MTRRVTSGALTGGLLLLVGAMTVVAFGFNEQARRVPLVIGIPTTVLLVVQLIRDARGAADEPAAELTDDDGVATPVVPTRRGEADPDLAGVELRTTAPVAFGWVLLLAASFYVFGLLLTVPLFMAAFMRIYGSERWLTVVVMAGGTAALLYGLFVLLLGVRLYPGLLGDGIGW